MVSTTGHVAARQRELKATTPRRSNRQAQAPHTEECVQIVVEMVEPVDCEILKTKFSAIECQELVNGYYLTITKSQVDNIRKRQFPDITGIYIITIPALNIGEMPMIIPGDSYQGIETRRSQSHGRHIKGSKIPFLEK